MSSPTTTAPQPVLDDASRALLDSIDADPQAPFAATIRAPGGYGKSSLLAEARLRYRRAEVPVRDGWTGPAGPVAAPTMPLAGGGSLVDPPLAGYALLVDDAHLLDEGALRELYALARTGRVRLLLAYRPWPCPPGLAELADLVRRDRPAVLLAPFTLDQTAAFLERIWGVTAQPAVVAFVQQQSGGVPAYVDRLARALGGLAGPQPSPVEIPEAALAPFAADLERQPGDVRRLLLGLAAGVDIPVDLLDRTLATTPASPVPGDTPGGLVAGGSALAAARAAGLLGRDDRLPPILLRAIGALSPPIERAEVWRRLATLQLSRGAPVLPLVRPMLGTVGGSGYPAGLLTAAADEALTDEPALAADLFAAAVAAGGAATARQATAAALAGDLDSALRMADRLIEAAEPTERSEAAAVTAAALTHRGQPGRAADLYRWSGTVSSLAFAAIGAVGTGDPGELDKLLREPPDGPPTLLTGAATQTARGVRETLSEPPTVALATLVRAAALLEPAGRAVLLPDSPAALAALVAIHCGEFDVAERVLERAVANRTGAVLMARRHLLLQAWILMVRGRCGAAADRLALATGRDGAHADGTGPPAVAGWDATITPGTPGKGGLEARDLLFATGLELGIARRNSDLPALRRAWEQAGEAVIRHPVDLFTLLPLGELAVAAARLGDLAQLTPYLREAATLLERLGDPALWATPLHWSNLHAAIIAERPADADAHVAALIAAADHSRYAATLAAAARRWVEVLRGTVDPVGVEAAARGLHGIGLCWDGARLAGQAAIRTSDRKAMTALLDCARVLQGRTGGTGRATTAGGEPPGARDSDRLSDREQEVADLVLAGLTYRQIGDRLFISAKTVEHHVARIRQRLNCANRGELLARLRAMADDRAGGDPVGPPWPPQAAR
nr:helix-turn-helix transcriptional regulator [Micromonospora sp. DSM 115978]